MILPSPPFPMWLCSHQVKAELFNKPSLDQRVVFSKIVFLKIFFFPISKVFITFLAFINSYRSERTANTFLSLMHKEVFSWWSWRTRFSKILVVWTKSFLKFVSCHTNKKMLKSLTPLHFYQWSCQLLQRSRHGPGTAAFTMEVSSLNLLRSSK